MHTLSRPTSRSILWPPTTALAGVNAAVTLSWIIYRVHLAGLLTQAGFPATFAPVLLLIESILAIGIEPLAGKTSDWMMQRIGSRFWIIGVGAGATALLFLLLPMITQSLSAETAPQHWFVGLLILWAVAISIFRSPALALLGSYASSKQLPIAASLVTLAGALAGSATPLATPWLLSLGVAPTFLLAALIVGGTFVWLRGTQPNPEAVNQLVPEHNSSSFSFWHGLQIFGAGLAVSLVFRLAIELYPKVLKAANLQPPLFMGAIFISLALGALVAGRLASQWGNAKVMQLGYGFTAAGLLLLLLPQTAIGAVLIAIAFGVSFSFIFNGVLPWILNNLSNVHFGLGVGLFFSGAATASSLYSGVLVRLTGLTPIWMVGLGLIALLIAAFCMMQRSIPSPIHR